MSDLTQNQIKLQQLRQYQGMPLSAKIRLSEMRIREWYDAFDGKVYVAFSGGKDSTVLLDLVRNIYPGVPAVFADTGNELESVLKFVRMFGDAVTWVKPKMTFEQVVEKYGYPILSKNICMGISRYVSTKSLKQKKLRAFGGINPSSGKIQAPSIPKKYHYILKAVLSGGFKATNKCCGVLKVSPTQPYERRTGNVPFVGTMAEESDTRLRSYLNSGCNAFEKGSRASRPLMFWTNQDVLQYIREKNLPISEAYGKIEGDCGSLKCSGEQRTGCKFCLFGIQFEKGENRIQRLARVEPESYRHAIEDLRYDKVMDFLGIEWRPIDKMDKQLEFF